MSPTEVLERIPRAALRLERTLAGAVVLLPCAGVVAALVWAGRHGVSCTDIGLAGGMYLLTGFGITVGYHRLLTHGSFRCPRWVRAGLAIAGSMALQGPVVRWVADHRRHHAHSDRPGDPHSPQPGAHAEAGARRAHLWHAHVGWLFAPGKTRLRRFAPDLLRDADIARIDRLYAVWALASLGLPAVLGGLLSGTSQGAWSGLLWGGLVRIFLVHHVTWSINSLCHSVGQRPFVTRDASTNNAWLALPSLGESWHNAHHAFPTSARHGLGRFAIDPSARLIWILEKLHLAWDVRRPSAEHIEARRAPATPSASAPSKERDLA